jgi:ATP-dependent Lhr-like helicase
MQGAMFFSEIARSMGSYPGDILSALWSLIFAGEVSTDSFQAVRGYLLSHCSETTRSRERRYSAMRSLRPVLNRAVPKGAEGRFYLRSSRSKKTTDSTTTTLQVVEVLLNRYGIVTRDVAELEAVAGGFSSLYAALSVMEQNGRVRRGYFISGCGGAQFATPAAIEALRACKSFDIDAPPIILSAVDPANPYGSIIPWPSCEHSRCIRCAGAFVALHNGSILGYLAKGNNNLVIFTTGEKSDDANRARILANALISFATTKRLSALHFPLINSQNASQCDVTPIFLAQGFILAGDGLLYRNSLLKEG